MFCRHVRWLGARLSLFTSAALIFFLSCIINPSFTGALAPVSDVRLSEYLSMPTEFGEIIYRLNEKSPRQLYIVASSHRGTEDSLNNDNTVQTQAEIFRIGEWLNKCKDIELVLPEGFFNAKGVEVGLVQHAKLDLSDTAGINVNNALLHEKLADQTRYVNAEILLMEYFKMHASQVEDEAIYNAVCRVMHKMRIDGSKNFTLVEMQAQLLYLQQLRTAKLLQKIPLVIEEERGSGTIRNSTAMFTIGLSHIPDIIRYLDESRIWVNAPTYPGSTFKSHLAELNLLKKDFGITIIIPRTLADDRKLLQMTSLDSLLLAREGI